MRKPQTNADVPSLTLGQDKTAQALVQRSLRKSVVDKTGDRNG